MKENDIIIFITVIAIALADVLTDDEIDVLSSAFNQLGDTLNTISAQRELLNNKTNNISDGNSNNCDNN